MQRILTAAEMREADRITIKGRGIPASGGAGDLYVVLKIVLPPADTETARLAYQEMAQRLAFDPRAGLKEGLGE